MCLRQVKMPGEPSGFREKEHRADWELEVWAPDLPELLVQAALGMYWLMDARLEGGSRHPLLLEFSGVDEESQLVGFLQELLYLTDSKGLAFDRFAVTIDGEHGRAELSSAPLAYRAKEIKAVTYHNLEVRQTPAGLETTLVFDV
jgi:SHS2 domain-containing protein